MSGVEVRIRIGRIVSDRPVDAQRERFAESLSAEVGALLAHHSRVESAGSLPGDTMAAHIARAIAEHVPRTPSSPSSNGTGTPQ
jgi:hypothetical protein